MTADAVADLPRQVQAAAVVLQHIDNSQTLLVVPQAAGHQRVQHLLARMTERRVAKVVAKGDGFGQLFVEPQHLRNRPRDLRHLERVREPVR